MSNSTQSVSKPGSRRAWKSYLLCLLLLAPPVWALFWSYSTLTPRLETMIEECGTAGFRAFSYLPWLATVPGPTLYLLAIPGFIVVSLIGSFGLKTAASSHRLRMGYVICITTLTLIHCCAVALVYSAFQPLLATRSDAYREIAAYVGVLHRFDHAWSAVTGGGDPKLAGKTRDLKIFTVDQIDQVESREVKSNVSRLLLIMSHGTRLQQASIATLAALRERKEVVDREEDILAAAETFAGQAFESLDALANWIAENSDNPLWHPLPLVVTEKR